MRSVAGYKRIDAVSVRDGLRRICLQILHRGIVLRSCLAILLYDPDRVLWKKRIVRVKYRKEVYRSLIGSFYRNSSLALIVYSIDNKNTFNEIDFWINSVKENLGDDINGLWKQI